MPSDPELSALQTKLTEATAGSAFTPRERELLVDGLRRIEADPDARPTPFHGNTPEPPSGPTEFVLSILSKSFRSKTNRPSTQ